MMIVGLFVVFSFVPHVRHEAGVAIHVVGDNLTAAVWKDYRVGSFGIVSIPALLMTVIVVIAVLDGIIKVVVRRGSLRRVVTNMIDELRLSNG